MEDKEVIRSIQEYLGSQSTAEGAEPPQVQSLDFDALQDAGGPRDGRSRPILVGSTRPTPPYAPAAQPPRSRLVTSVHDPQPPPSALALQEVLGGTVVAEGASVAELEQALSLRAGTVSVPASRWSHGPGATRRLGGSASRAPLQSAQDVALSVGSMLPPRADTGTLAALPPPPPTASRTLAAYVPPAGAFGGALAGFDVGDAVADLLACPDPLPEVLSGAIARDECVAAALAHAASAVRTAPPTHVPIRTSAQAPSVGALAPPLHPDPLVAAALQHAYLVSSRQVAEATAARIATYADAAARARHLVRVGMALEASELMAAMPPPLATVAARPASDTVVSLRPPTTPPIAGVAFEAALVDSSCMLAWPAARIVQASSMPVPLPGAILTPTQVAVEGIAALPPGARRARVASLAAAARLVPFMALEQVSKLLGCPVSVLMERPIEYVAADAVHVIGFGWAAGTINGGRLSWCRIVEFARRNSALHARDGSVYVYGYVVRKFLDYVDSQARAKYLLTHPSGAGKVTDARGAAARGGQAANCLWLASNLAFPIQMDSVSVKLVVKASRRKTSKQAPALGPRYVYVLCWLVEYGESEWVQCHAAGWLSAVMFALRHVNMQRACVISVANDTVTGACDLDAKIQASEQTGRPMWAAARDMRGSTEWVRRLMHMRDAPPRTLNHVGVAEDPHYLMRDTNSPDGDPTRATGWIDAPLTGARALKSLHALGVMSPWALDPAVVQEKTLHSAKHDLNCVSRAGGDPPGDTNEVGKWSGSIAQTAELADMAARSALRAAHSGAPLGGSELDLAMPELYSRETAEEIVPAIMERQVSRLRALATSPGIDHLPQKGGWRFIPRDGATAPIAAAPSRSSAAIPPCPPLLAIEE